jgi:signal transduction histidine kinase
VERPPSTWTWVSALAIGGFQLVGSFGAAGNQPERRSIDALAVVLILAGPVALAVRDRWPLVAVGVSLAAVDIYIGIGYPYGPIFLSIVVALYSAVQAGRRQATWLLAAAGYVGYAIASWVDPRSDPDQGVLHLALVAGWLVGVLAVSELVRISRANTAERVRVQQEDEERRRSAQRLALAQDLHDVLAHDISLINVQAGVALHLLDEHPEQARPALATIKDASRDALHELRAALDVLRRGDDAPRAPAPTLADLDALVSAVRAGGLEVEVDREVLPSALPAEVQLAAFRIVQESLTNVSRHARATRAAVRFRGDDSRLMVEVEDDGTSDAAAGQAAGTTGMGISGMRRRAEALGGTLEAGPRAGGGFRVVAVLPVRNSDGLLS